MAWCQNKNLEILTWNFNLRYQLYAVYVTEIFIISFLQNLHAVLIKPLLTLETWRILMKKLGLYFVMDDSAQSLRIQKNDELSSNFNKIHFSLF